MKNKTDSFEDYKKKYLKASVLKAPTIKNKMIKDAHDTFDSLLANSSGNEAMISRLIIENDITEVVEDATLEEAFGYLRNKNIIAYNPQNDYFDMYDYNFALCHELTHKLDYNTFHSWENQKFKDAYEICAKRIKAEKEQIASWFMDGGKYEDDAAISDIISALSKAEMNDFIIAGHEEEYWNDEINLYSELLANISSVDIIGYNSKELFNGMLKEFYDAYEEIVKWN